MTEFKGETREVKRLHSCPACGAKAVLRKDSTKRFQVACSKCGCRTGWKPKTEAVIDWYNLVLAVRAEDRGKKHCELDGERGI